MSAHRHEFDDGQRPPCDIVGHDELLARLAPPAGVRIYIPTRDPFGYVPDGVFLYLYGERLRSIAAGTPHAPDIRDWVPEPSYPEDTAAVDIQLPSELRSEQVREFATCIASVALQALRPRLELIINGEACWFDPTSPHASVRSGTASGSPDPSVDEQAWRAPSDGGERHG